MSIIGNPLTVGGGSNRGKLFAYKLSYATATSYRYGSAMLRNEDDEHFVYDTSAYSFVCQKAGEYLIDIAAKSIRYSGGTARVTCRVLLTRSGTESTLVSVQSPSGSNTWSTSLDNLVTLQVGDVLGLQAQKSADNNGSPAPFCMTIHN